MRNIPKYFHVEQSGNALIISAVSNINLLLDEDVRDECDLLIDQLSQHNATNLVIDLGAVDHFGSVMLELMIILWKHIKTGTGKFVVCNVSAVGKQVLQTTSLIRVWRFRLFVFHLRDAQRNRRQCTQRRIVQRSDRNSVKRVATSNI
jgi:anti-anti-sigma factor